ncbi:uncharacterized protein BCR38DRAFT_341330 [Pseudomassariella vexata]|uniref:Uncharacterized protein n=1 Tax=Pseudomassariella vexata TaxID=1141098 RepID=A0A1Y2E1J5_9PEZI|nr:uncharacterized protein BCR38DRAFT_341330 [Pseudomassariella vexata]ORY65421.1 hypothetical protein BCR38DRAFT_341330 [Pseudomassariella vexata]
MLAPTETTSSTAQAGLYFDPLKFDRSSLPAVPSSQRAFKKHKVLPHPRNNKPYTTYEARPSGQLNAEPCAVPARPTLRSSKPPLRRVRPPDPPPTPPTHSRASSSSQSVLPPSPTYVESPAASAPSAAGRLPSTPPNQRSPPTPDVTPPDPTRRPKAFRPVLADRIPSKATTADSRADSFKTARETPGSSAEDLTLRLRASSGRTSQSTVRQSKDPKQNTTQGLGLRLESEENLTPRTKHEFVAFDGEWGSANDVEQEWDDNLMRNVTVRKRRNPPKGKGSNGRKHEVVEVVEDVTITPTNATKALRSIPLQDRVETVDSSPTKELGDRGSKHWTALSTSESSISTNPKRSSGMSTKSTVSTIVEAILVDTPPQRLKTLRHVKKQTGLRDSRSDLSPSSSTTNSIGLDENVRHPRGRARFNVARSESLASSGTVSSLASRKARREVWKNGGIPVIVIPDRRTSMKSMATPSLRSTSSRRSQRSNSLSSVPLSSVSKAKEKDLSLYLDRPSRRGRTLSESDGSLPGDQRTIDYPPMVPVRTSSLSAPTSRNTSRAGSLAGSRTGSRSNSLTAESLTAHNAVQGQHKRLPPPKVTVERVPSSHRDAHDHRPLVDHNGDPFFGKRLTTHNTPFSIASVETNGTHSAAEVSEAMAVNIYPHQNKSVLMVDHTSSKSGETNVLQRQRSAGTDEMATTPVIDKPKIITSSPDGGPVTPPQPWFSMDEVDSPLRNPRAPPEPPALAVPPPAIKFIPATPSGLTPAADKMKMLGNYFEETERRPSLVKRALSLRVSSDGSAQRPGFLLRTLSMSKNTHKDTSENSAVEKGKDAILTQYPTANDPPPDEARLHPFWRPTSSLFDSQGDEDWVYDITDEGDRVYRYPPVDNRPSPPRRSLSQRMKNTFAILPVANDDHYTAADSYGPERRTIKRTKSGNLRVMRHQNSYSSMRWGRSASPSSLRHRSQSQAMTGQGRPSTAPDRTGRRMSGVEKRQYGLQNLQRRLSEHRRQKRTDALRGKISGPREVRDGVGEVIKRKSYKGQVIRLHLASRATRVIAPNGTANRTV